MELTLGPQESGWGTKPEDVPPSLGPFANNMVPRDESAIVDQRWEVPRMGFGFVGSQ